MREAIGGELELTVFGGKRPDLLTSCDSPMALPDKCGFQDQQMLQGSKLYKELFLKHETHNLQA